MRIKIKLFAILRDRAGVSELELELPSNATAASAGATLITRLPALQSAMGSVAYAVNREYAPATTVLNDGDELALIPPVSGG